MKAMMLFLFVIGSSLSAQNSPEFMESAIIEHGGESSRVTSRDPRPLNQAITGVREEYGLLVDYEDTVYLDADLVDSTDPNWRRLHPQEKGARRVRGREFSAVFPELPVNTVPERAASMNAITKIVMDYNGSGNPGKFAVRSETQGHLVVVGVASAGPTGTDESRQPVLDSRISIPAGRRTAFQTIEMICEAVSRKSGRHIVLGIVPMNLLVQAEVEVGGQEMAARTLLLETIAATGRPLLWNLLFDPDPDQFFLNVGVATINQLDGYGRKIAVPIDRR